MRSLSTLLIAAAALLIPAQAARAALVWADDVEAYTSKIQNYGGTLMSSSTESWVLGAPDAAVNGDETGLDPDYVAGWRGNAPGEYIVVSFDTGLADAAGDDLTIRMFSGPNAGADVLASVNGTAFTKVGELGTGDPFDFRNETFDFGGAFSGAVKYVKVERVANGSQTGMFFDAFGGNPVPEPSSIVMLTSVAGFLAVFMWRRRRKAR
jgi:hypothetical protein